MALASMIRQDVARICTSSTDISCNGKKYTWRCAEVIGLAVTSFSTEKIRMTQNWQVSWHHGSVLAQHGSVGGDSASSLEDLSHSPSFRTHGLWLKNHKLQTWFDDQDLLGAADNLGKSLGVANDSDKSAIARHETRATAIIKRFDDLFRGVGESKIIKRLNDPKHHPPITKAIHNGLSKEDDTSTKFSMCSLSMTTGESRGASERSQDGQISTRTSLNIHDFSTPTLYKMKEDLIKRIMEKFRVGDWLPKTTGHTGKSSSQTPSDVYEGHVISSSLAISNRRARNTDDSSKGGKKAEKPYDRPSKPPRKSENTRQEQDRMLDFACPFKKRHPSRYGLDGDRSCTVGHWPSIALMKQHLYRRHKSSIQCQRCWTRFRSQTALNSHMRLSTPCQLLEHNPLPVMTVELELWLKTEKRPGISEVDRWKAILEKLFPGSQIPSPYFDPLIDFHSFEQVEVPRIFEESVRALIAEEMQPIEERIIERMRDLVRSSQERALSNYMAIYNMPTEAESQEDLISSLPQSLSLHPYNHDSGNLEEPNNGQFLGNNDLLMCGCHGSCICSRNPYESAILLQRTTGIEYSPVDISENNTVGNNTAIAASQEPVFTSTNIDDENETVEWPSWIND